MALDLQPPNFSALAALAGTRVGGLGLAVPKTTGWQGLNEGLQAGMARGDKKDAQAQEMQLNQQKLAQQQSQFNASQGLDQQKMDVLKQNADTQAKKEEHESAVKEMQAQLKSRVDQDKEQLNKRGALASAYIVGYKQAQSPEDQAKVKEEMLGHAHNSGIIDDTEFTKLDKLDPKALYSQSLIDLMVTNKASELKALMGGKENEGALAGDRAGATTATKTELQKGEVNVLDRMRQVEQIGNKYADSYLTTGGAVKGFAGEMSSKLGLAGKVPGAAGAEEFLTKKSEFTTTINKMFSNYVHDMTGAGMGMQEFDRRKQEMINASDSPAEFKGKLKALLTDMTKGLELKQEFQKKGIPLNSPEFKDAWDKRVNKISEQVNGGGAAPETPGTYQYKGQTYTDKDIDETAKAHGISREEVLKKLGV